MSVLITGAAGFIGFNLCKKLLEQGTEVIGFDNFNDYYDPKLKRSRINELIKISSEFNSKFNLIEADLEDSKSLKLCFKKYIPLKVVHLAAQAGVRYSIENPSAYIQSNLVGFGNILEECRRGNIKNFIYASSSSVYGGNTNMPFSEKQSVDHPVSLYAATKKANELMAHTYSHLYNIPSIGLRFFTVYGPWGRPDMALFLFTKAILNGESIKVFNHGKMTRDFTYVDDIVKSINLLLSKPARKDIQFNSFQPNPSTSWAPYRIFNIGNSKPIALMEYISAIEEKLGIVAKKDFVSMQTGDVVSTSADVSSLEEWINFKPSTTIKDGIGKFIDWYKDYYQI